MTIDERLEQLAKRHEALTQGVELLLLETRELRAMQEAMQEKEANDIRAVKAAMELDAGNIRALARFAEMREHRISRIEGGE